MEPGAEASRTDEAALGTDEECARRLQQEFDLEVAEKAARARFDCPLCLEPGTFEHSVELDCLHRLCRGCFFRFLEVKIREKRVTEEVEGATKSTPLWDRFLASRAELWRPYAPEDGQLCECPGTNCGYRFLAGADLKEVRCPQCKVKFCPRCRAEHSGVSCEAYAAWRRENDTAELEFERLVRAQCWQRCPCCGAACERSHGCNFMTCHSEVCRGNRSFCYLCAKELTAIQHFTHFPHGLFENVCENVDRRGEEALPKARFFEARQANWWTGLVDDFRGWMWGGEGHGEGPIQGHAKGKGRGLSR